jgi:hypothetical protein
LLNAPKDFKTTLQNTLHYEDLLAEQSDEYEWPVLNENDACGMLHQRHNWFAQRSFVFPSLNLFTCLQHNFS